MGDIGEVHDKEYSESFISQGEAFPVRVQAREDAKSLKVIKHGL